MTTKNIDLAAYLHLNGVDPVESRLDERGNAVMTYEEDDFLGTLLEAFDSGAMVPAKAFAEARHTVKETYSSQARNAVRNHKNAIALALERAKKRAEEEAC